jgi:hypothetical protein
MRKQDNYYGVSYKDIFSIKYLHLILTLLIIGNVVTISLNINQTQGFSNSDPTIFNYIEAYSDKKGLLRDKNYPTFNLQSYHPGPNPYMYLLYLSWEINKLTGVNVMYLFNLFLLIMPYLYLSIIFYILYRYKLNNILLSALAFTLLIPLTNTITYLNATSRGSNRVDIGTVHISIFAYALFLSLLISIKKPNSSHLILLLTSALVIQQHFTGLALGSLAFLYAILLIYRSNNRAKLYKYVITLFIGTTPLIIRFINDPLFIYKAVKRNNIITSNTNGVDRIFIDNYDKGVEFLYSLTPFSLIRCGNVDKSCFDEKVPFIAITAVLSLIYIIYLLIKSDNIAKIFIITFTIFMLYQISISHEPNHGANIIGLIYGIINYFVSKLNIKKIIFLSLSIILYSLINLNTIIYMPDTYRALDDKFLKIISNEKIKFNICPLLYQDTINCSEGNSDIMKIYNGDNIGQIFLLELLNNRNDICLYPNNIKLGSLDKLKCTDKELLDKNRMELFTLPDTYNLLPNKINKYYKLAHFSDKRKVYCNNIKSNIDIACKNQLINDYGLDTSGTLYGYKEGLNIKYYIKLLDISNNKLLNYDFTRIEDQKYPTINEVIK